ncbi:nucleotide exchange factor GrpE [Streptomyces sp. B1866]|uniref:nucleotide exchange factor GrpE n=1 Tax=Streptomyces sp. B1866 TaxID=3075431 RepID=UPI002891B3C2|nr:nucleotide exchange factor GrpE [Streptomyces sp. B1866]MDT3395192.1 nucleotide exchange factor GrpE [Streptomyces sp. B1866]
MSRPNGPARPGGPRPLSVVGGARRSGPGARQPGSGALEPRHRSDVEPLSAPRPAGPAGLPAGRPDRERADALRRELRERTEELRRVRAEYDTYRRRVRRDRVAVREIAVANVLGGLLPVLDAIGRAREQGEVNGGFERVVRLLESGLAGLGLQPFGAVGDPFDPTFYEAVAYALTDQVDRPTCTEILRPGYLVGDHLLRAAQAAVGEPPVGETPG